MHIPTDVLYCIWDFLLIDNLESADAIHKCTFVCMRWKNLILSRKKVYYLTPIMQTYLIKSYSSYRNKFINNVVTLFSEQDLNQNISKRISKLLNEYKLLKKQDLHLKLLNIGTLLLQVIPDPSINKFTIKEEFLNKMFITLSKHMANYINLKSFDTIEDVSCIYNYACDFYKLLYIYLPPNINNKVPDNTLEKEVTVNILLTKILAKIIAIFILIINRS